MKAIFFLCLVVPSFLCAFPTHAELFSGASDVTQTSLLELYTSEGCSSCPPAEVWLGKLKDDPGLWKNCVPVSLHVDYWDRLGWKDRFASREFTSRQYAYSKTWKTESVYTPGFVLNGAEWQRGSGLPGKAGSKPGVLEVKETAAGKFSVAFRPTETGTRNWRFYLAVLDFDVVSEVSAGENAGRKLIHDFVVRSLAQKAGVANEAKFELKLPEAGGTRRLALGVWVSRDGELKPVQAVGGWWKP